MDAALKVPGTTPKAASLDTARRPAFTCTGPVSVAEPANTSVPSPSLTSDAPVAERDPPNVAVIWGATTLKEAVPGASDVLPFKVRLLVPPNVTLPAATTEFLI